MQIKPALFVATIAYADQHSTAHKWHLSDCLRVILLPPIALVYRQRYPKFGDVNLRTGTGYPFPNQIFHLVCRTYIYINSLFKNVNNCQKHFSTAFLPRKHLFCYNTWISLNLSSCPSTPSKSPKTCTSRTGSSVR